MTSGDSWLTISDRVSSEPLLRLRGSSALLKALAALDELAAGSNSRLARSEPLTNQNESFVLGRDRDGRIELRLDVPGRPVRIIEREPLRDIYAWLQFCCDKRRCRKLPLRLERSQPARPVLLVPAGGVALGVDGGQGVQLRNIFLKAAALDAGEISEILCFSGQTVFLKKENPAEFTLSVQTGETAAGVRVTRSELARLALVVHNACCSAESASGPSGRQ